MPEDHGSGVYGQVEASWRTECPPQETIDRAMKASCPDCNVNVFISEDPRIDGVYHFKLAHDDTCPWLKFHES